MNNIKNLITLVAALFACTISFSQLTEGQNFCDESKDGSYFPLVINKKTLLWSDTHYTEEISGSKEIKGKTYVAFEQQWKAGNVNTLYLREENGVVYQYEECCEKETTRYDKNFEKGHIWKTADGLGEYKILSYQGKLKTPYCEYQNLMVIEANIEYGKYEFYYLKGHGYVGATLKDKVISCVAPKLTDE